MSGGGGGGRETGVWDQTDGGWAPGVDVTRAGGVGRARDGVYGRQMYGGQDYGRGIQGVHEGELRHRGQTTGGQGEHRPGGQEYRRGIQGVQRGQGEHRPGGQEEQWSGIERGQWDKPSRGYRKGGAGEPVGDKLLLGREHREAGGDRWSWHGGGGQLLGGADRGAGGDGKPLGGLDRGAGEDGRPLGVLDRGAGGDGRPLGGVDKGTGGDGKSLSGGRRETELDEWLLPRGDMGAESQGGGRVGGVGGDAAAGRDRARAGVGVGPEEATTDRLQEHQKTSTRTLQLLEAADSGNEEAVRRCVEAGATPDEELLPLHFACSHGHVGVARCLLEAGASTSEILKGYAAVHWAAYGGHMDVLELLKEYGSDFSAAAKNGSTPLHLAAKHNLDESVVVWLTKEGVPLEALNKKDQTPLNLAEEFAGVKTKNYLKKVVAENQLQEAASDGDLATLEQLLSRRVDVNARSLSRKFKGWQALHRAAEEGQVEAVERLLHAGAHVDDRTSSEGPMAVHLAAQGGHLKVVELLLLRMGDRGIYAKAMGKQLIHLAAIGGHIHVLEFLFENNFDVNALTSDGLQQTALHLACECQNNEAARWLVGARCDVTKEDSRGYLARDVAREMGDTHLAEYLKKMEGAFKEAPHTPTALVPVTKKRGILEKGIDWVTGRQRESGRDRDRSRGRGRGRGGSRDKSWPKNLPKGLESFGNTCYLNAVVQCLYHTTRLTSFFLHGDWRSYKTSSSSSSSSSSSNAEYCGEVAESYSKVVEALSAKEDTLRPVYCLKKTVGQYDSTFSGNDQQEAHDLLAFLLDALDKDLQGQGRSLPSQVFFGEHLSTITCENTGKEISRVKEPFANLSLPVTRQGATQHLGECLEKYYSRHFLQWDCPECRCTHECARTTYITVLPQVLIIHLSRVVDSPHDPYKETVTFPTKLMEVNAYTCPEQRQREYELYGVCHHAGTSSRGHYTATCRSLEGGNKWHSFNDEAVRQCTGEPSFRGAHLLFYESVE